MSKKVKIFVFVVIGLIVIIIAASVLSKGGNSNSGSNSALSSSTLPSGVKPAVSSAVVDTQGASDFATLLSSVNTIKIDTKIFSDIAYQSLRDYPVSLGTDVIGRPNPFAPIGIDVGNVVTTTTTTPSNNTTITSGPGVVTLTPGKVTKAGAEFGARVTLADASPVNVVFEYGINDTFGSMTTPVVLTKSDNALTTVSNLLPNTTYLVRAVLVRGSSTITGDTVQFKTLK